MGISLIPGLFLARHAGAVKECRRGLILGRQKIHMKADRMRRFLTRLGREGFALTEDQVTQADGFSERLFAAMGYPPIEALDFTAAEGAQHIHDLNLPCPEALRGQFDLVIDGGTTEHVFHIGTALDTCHALLKPGGVMMSFVSADGMFGHGFFQTGPDVPWRYWHAMRGYRMLEVSLAPRRAPDALVPVPDPTGAKRGGEMELKGPHMLLYAARKPLTDPPATSPIQSHYA